MNKYNLIKTLPLLVVFSTGQLWEILLPLAPVAVSLLTSLIVLIVSLKCSKQGKKQNIFSLVFQKISELALEITKLYSPHVSSTEAQSKSSELQDLEQHQQEQSQKQEQSKKQIEPCNASTCPFYSADFKTHCAETKCVFNLHQIDIEDIEK